MSLVLQKHSPWWWSHVQLDGKRKVFKLPVRVDGMRPSSLKDRGDRSFEKSRSAASLAEAKLLEPLKRQGAAEELLERVIEMKTGAQLEKFPLAQISEKWALLPRGKPLNARYESQARSTITRFANFLAEQFHVTDLCEVTSTMLQVFLSAEQKRGISPKTFNDVLKLLRGLFRRLLPESIAYRKALLNASSKVSQTVHRKPFTPEEIARILEAAATQPLVRPIIVTGLCTAMRRGDCCLLRWQDVDLQAGFLNVKTSKTGEMVTIPIFPLLRELFSNQPLPGNSNPDGFCFPEAAKMYQENPDGITWRVQKILERANFPEHELSATRRTGLRRASVRDFHSFRVTWITIALAGGVPMELVRRVTGHQTTEIVLKHYFQPGREEFRKALVDKMRQLALINGNHKGPGLPPTPEKSSLREALELAASLESENLDETKFRLVQILEDLVQKG
jgi:integrase